MNVMREKAHQIKDETIAFRRDLHMHPEARSRFNGNCEF